MDTRMPNKEFKGWLKGRTRTFAVTIFRLIDQLPCAPSSTVIANQLGKSASSMGANYREATRAESRADFAHKIGVVEKEADETLYWLEVLSDLYPEPHALHRPLEPLLSESEELLRLFTTIQKNSKEPAASR